MNESFIIKLLLESRFFMDKLSFVNSHIILLSLSFMIISFLFKYFTICFERVVVHCKNQLNLSVKSNLTKSVFFLGSIILDNFLIIIS